MMNPLGRTLIAALSEFTGTVFLTLAALTVASPVIAFAVALTLMVFVYSIGDISGCHLNPAVTVGLVAARQFPLGEGLVHIIAQICGAIAARALVSLALVGLGNYAAASPVAEFMGFGILMLAVAAVTENRSPGRGAASPSAGRSPWVW